jgi:hypothetical protein
MRELRKMEDHFPALLMVVTNPVNLAYWHARFPLPQAAAEQEEVEQGDAWWSELIQLVLAVVAGFVLYYSRTRA